MDVMQAVHCARRVEVDPLNPEGESSMKKTAVLCLLALVALVVPAYLMAEAPAAGQHAAIGPEKCGKMCHKVEYESWLKTKHATAKEQVSCETCHGNGADYAKMAIMKDAAKAKAAGLVLPTKATCTAKCHKPADITDAKFASVHEHKAKK